MRARLAALSLALVVMTVGLAAPPAALAAPVTPDGQALIRIDGGTAYSKELGKLTYRIKAPKGASITWLGKARGRTDTGTFSSKALVAGWAKLGHKGGETASTTLTWIDGSSKIPTFVEALIGNPRVNAKGELTFLAVTRSELPQAMPNFSINVSWAAPQTATRKWPVATTAFPIDDPTKPTAIVQASVPSNSSSTTTFSSVSSTGTSTACPNSSYVYNMAASPYQVKIATAACGNGSLQSKYTMNGVTFNSLVSAAPAIYPYTGAVSVAFGYTPTGKSTFAFAKTIATWDEYGNPPAS